MNTATTATVITETAISATAITEKIEFAGFDEHRIKQRIVAALAIEVQASAAQILAAPREAYTQRLLAAIPRGYRPQVPAI